MSDTITHAARRIFSPEIGGAASMCGLEQIPTGERWSPKSPHDHHPEQVTCCECLKTNGVKKPGKN